MQLPVLPDSSHLPGKAETDWDFIVSNVFSAPLFSVAFSFLSCFFSTLSSSFQVCWSRCLHLHFLLLFVSSPASFVRGQWLLARHILLEVEVEDTAFITLFSTSSYWFSGAFWPLSPLLSLMLTLCCGTGFLLGHALDKWPVMPQVQQWSLLPSTMM